MEETKTFSATVKLTAMREYAEQVLKLVDVFGEAETIKMLRALSSTNT